MFFVIIKDSWIEKCLGHFQNVIDWFNQNEGFVSVILALLTILATVLIPLFIAKKQNKIALYEKRFVCYQKYESLKSFCSKIKDISTFSTSENSKVNQHWYCQQQYFSAHALLDDTEFQRDRFNPIRQYFYARSCLEEDRKMLLSLKLLVGGDELANQADKTQKALEVFLQALFEDILTQSNYERDAFDQKVLEKKNDFVAQFEQLEKFEKELETLLKIEKQHESEKRK